jgi:hypothetical protein
MKTTHRLFLGTGRGLKLLGTFLQVALLGAVTSVSATALAQGKVSRSSSNDPYRSFQLSLPIISLTRDAMIRMEFNMWANGALALEAGSLIKGEANSERMIEETGENFENQGSQYSLIWSSFSRANSMSGFYWSLGAGWRKMTADWRRNAKGDEALGLVDEQGRVTHAVVGEGMTGHGRLGYRWVGQSFPMVLGAYAGLRHFAATFEDDSSKSGEQRISATSDSDLAGLKRRFATQFEPGLELGFAF